MLSSGLFEMVTGLFQMTHISIVNLDAQRPVLVFPEYSVSPMPVARLTQVEAVGMFPASE